MAQTIWTEAGPITTTERTSPEWIEQAETSAAASAADPVPLGMAAYGLTIFLLGAIYAFFANPRLNVAMVIPVAFWFGGVTLFLTGMWAMRKGSTFTATTLGVLSGFWLTWAGIQFWAPAAASPAVAGAIYLGLFGIVTAYLFVVALQVNAALAAVLGITTLTFWANALGIGLGSLAWLRVGGWCAMITGVLAFYISYAMVMDCVACREVVPLGRPARVSPRIHQQING